MIIVKNPIGDNMKKWYESRTIWLGNAVTVLGGVVLALHESGQLSPIMAMLPPNITPIATIVLGVTINYLRAKTTLPLKR